MFYSFQDISLTAGQREQANRLALDQAKADYNPPLLTKEQIFLLFSGKGNTHSFSPNDFDSFSSFIQTKRETDLGQFFTSPKTAEEIFATLAPERIAKVLDPCCGAGVFCNFMSFPKNFMGIDIDNDNISIAQYLYPQAEWINKSVLNYYPDVKLDYVITNPPFNFRWDGDLSQFYILRKASIWLKDKGFIAIIVPENYLADEFYFKSQISFINETFSFLGQSVLTDAFSVYNLKYRTKVMFFQKGQGKPYENVFTSLEEIASNVVKAKREKISFLNRESNSFSFKQGIVGKEEDAFPFIAKKLLYEIKIQKPDRYEEALAIVSELYTQRQPASMSSEEWVNVRLTPKKALYRLKMILSGRKKKGNPHYSPAINPYQWVAFDEIEPEKEIVSFLDNFTFVSNGGVFYLNDIQKEDLGKQLMKNNGILNWEQGVGKTVGAFAMAEYRKLPTFIFGPANVVRNMWAGFLKENGKDVVEWKGQSLSELEGKYVLFAYSTVNRKNYKRAIKNLIRSLRKKNNDYFIILDEADNINNHSSNTYKGVRLFKKAKYKLAATGTLTRNNAAELYPILEVIYNNTLVNECSHMFIEVKGKLRKVHLREVGKKFDGKMGNLMFKRCFSPEKSTVFGIKKLNQDIRNYEHLLKIINFSSTVRTFKEVCEDIYTHEQILVNPSVEEREIQDVILNETAGVIAAFYEMSGNARKDAAMKIQRMLKLLIKSCSLPESFSRYVPVQHSNKLFKIHEMVKNMEGQHVAIGCTFKGTAKKYKSFLSANLNREIFLITGEVPIKQRLKILSEFKASGDGILVCTQQSLASGLNIEFVDKIIVESLQWNIPAISQWYFRFIRFNSENNKLIYFVNYRDSIETNLMSMLVTKERINKAIKCEEGLDLFEEFGLDTDFLSMVMEKGKDKDGKLKVSWGKQLIE